MFEKFAILAAALLAGAGSALILEAARFLEFVLSYEPGLTP